MSDENPLVVGLLEQLVDLHKAAELRQQQMLQLMQQNYDETRKRAEDSIALQRDAVRRQKMFWRAWLGLIATIFIGIVWLVYEAVHRYY